MKYKFVALAIFSTLLIACKQNEPEEAEPVALFSYQINGLTVTFVNQSQNAQTYSWKFGDTHLSKEENPTHTYAKAGTYTVILTATNVTKNSSHSEQFTLVQPEEPKVEKDPIAQFSYSVSGKTVTFNNTSTNASTYQWNFGDGNESTVKNPTHTYSDYGSYTVSLKAANSTKTVTTTKYITLTAPVPQNPKAGFTYKTAHPLKVVLTNTSTNATSYVWDFGDGQTSTEENPTHKYSGIGVYRVKLTAKANNMTHTYETNVTIEAPTTCIFSGIVFNKIPNNNYYYQIQLTDDYILSKTTYIWTGWYLLSSANIPYTVTFNSPKTLSISTSYVLRLYKSSSKTSGQAGGKGSWTADVTSTKLRSYPESVTYSDSSTSITMNFTWK